MKLNTFKLNHALVPLRLQGAEEGEEISDDTETKLKDAVETFSKSFA